MEHNDKSIIDYLIILYIHQLHLSHMCRQLLPIEVDRTQSAILDFEFDLFQ